jgi:hypothetical protein
MGLEMPSDVGKRQGSSRGAFWPNSCKGSARCGPQCAAAAHQPSAGTRWMGLPTSESDTPTQSVGCPPLPLA